MLLLVYLRLRNRPDSNPIQTQRIRRTKAGQLALPPESSLSDCGPVSIRGLCDRSQDTQRTMSLSKIVQLLQPARSLAPRPMAPDDPDQRPTLPTTWAPMPASHLPSTYASPISRLAPRTMPRARSPSPVASSASPLSPHPFQETDSAGRCSLRPCSQDPERFPEIAEGMPHMSSLSSQVSRDRGFLCQVPRGAPKREFERPGNGAVPSRALLTRTRFTISASGRTTSSKSEPI